MPTVTDTSVPKYHKHQYSYYHQKLTFTSDS